MKISASRAVVTGGGSGIGRAIVHELARRGCRVLVADIDDERASIVAAAAGAGAIAAHCDVADHEDVVRLADRADDVMGGVDIVFANAGVGVGGSLLDAQPEAIRWILDVNVTGAWNTASVFGKRLRDGGREGHLCLTGSEHSLGMQHAGMGLYTTTKMAVLGLADVLRAELPATIGISVLCPGLTDTDLHLSRRHGPLPQDPEPLLAFAGAVMSRGMAADYVGRAAVDGVERGDFLIVTHAASLPAAKRRYEEISAVFATQAPWSPEAERYEVNKVIAEVGRRLAGRRSTD